MRLNMHRRRTAKIPRAESNGHLQILAELRDMDARGWHSANALRNARRPAIPSLAEGLTEAVGEWPSSMSAVWPDARRTPFTGLCLEWFIAADGVGGGGLPGPRQGRPSRARQR